MKNKSRFIRIVAILILAIMLAGSFASCADPDDPDSTADASGNLSDVTADPNLDENGYLLDKLPDSLDYNQQTINVLVWDDVEHEEFEFELDALDGDIVEKSIYDRNEKTKNRLNLKIEFIRINGNSDNTNSWCTYVDNSVSVSARTFDIMAGYSLSIAACANKGYLFNMLDEDCEYLNFEMPWWSALLLEQATFGDNLYFASGDISRNALEMMYVCYANTELLERFNLENPQNYVESYDWTYEKFFEMCEGVYEDDGDALKNCTNDGGDTFGYITSGIHVDPWFYGSGATICERDSEGMIIESPSFQGERVVNTVKMLTDFLGGEFGIYTEKVTHQNAFGQGRSLFMIERARVSHRNLAADYGETKFVILPCPMYDAEQKKYITVMGNPFTLYAIASDIQDPSMASAFIECFASEGFRQVTPAVFELSLKTRYVDDPISGKMYDLIRENLTYDPGRIFCKALIDQSTFRNAVKTKANWTSASKAASKMLAIKLNKLNDNLNQ